MTTHCKGAGRHPGFSGASPANTHAVGCQPTARALVATQDFGTPPQQIYDQWGANPLEAYSGIHACMCVYIYAYIYRRSACGFGFNAQLHYLPSVRVSRQVRRRRSERETVFAYKCTAGVKNDSMRTGESVQLERSRSEASKRYVVELVITNSKSKVVVMRYWVMMRSLSKGSINIDP